MKGNHDYHNVLEIAIKLPVLFCTMQTKIMILFMFVCKLREREHARWGRGEIFSYERQETVASVVPSQGHTQAGPGRHSAVVTVSQLFSLIWK